MRGGLRNNWPSWLFPQDLMVVLLTADKPRLVLDMPVLMSCQPLAAGGSDENAKAIAKPLGLSVRGMGGEHTAIGDDGTVDISPSARFCIKESQIITALYKGIEQLKAAEDEAAANAPEAGGTE